MIPGHRSSLRRLLALARDGDLRALDRLLSHERAELLGLVRRGLGARLAARTEADDLFQEAALEALGSITSLRAHSLAGFRRWFLGIVRHRVLLLVRSSRARRRPQWTTALPDAHLQFRAPERVPEPECPASVAEAQTEGHGPSPIASNAGTLVADGRMAVLLHEVFESGWGTVAFLLDRPTREAARQVHVRARAQVRWFSEPGP